MIPKIEETDVAEDFTEFIVNAYKERAEIGKREQEELLGETVTYRHREDLSIQIGNESQSIAIKHFTNHF